VHKGDEREWRYHPHRGLTEWALALICNARMKQLGDNDVSSYAITNIRLVDFRLLGGGLISRWFCVSASICR